MNIEQKIAELKAKIERKPDDIKAYIDIAEEYRKTGEYAVALEYYKKAEELVKNNPKENEWSVVIFHGIGMVLLDIGENDEALHYLTEGLKIVKEKKYEELTDYFLAGIAGAFGELNMFTKEIAILEDLLKRNPEIHMPAIYNNLAYAHYGLENYQEAIRYFKKALEIAEKHQDISALFVVKINLGNLHIKIGDYINAEKYLLEALKDVKSIKNNYWKGAGYFSLGMLYKNKGDKKTAKKLLNRAYIFFKSAGIKELAKKVSKIIKEL